MKMFIRHQDRTIVPRLENIETGMVQRLGNVEDDVSKLKKDAKDNRLEADRRKVSMGIRKALQL